MVEVRPHMNIKVAAYDMAQLQNYVVTSRVCKGMTALYSIYVVHWRNYRTSDRFQRSNRIWASFKVTSFLNHWFVNQKRPIKTASSCQQTLLISYWYCSQVAKYPDTNGFTSINLPHYWPGITRFICSPTYEVLFDNDATPAIAYFSQS